MKKPGNIFLDSEGNVRLGDFGLATQRREKLDTNDDSEYQSEEVSTIYEAIDDISKLLIGSRSITSNNVSQASFTESMTGGVGTMFYRAPEQEGTQYKAKIKGESSYNIQVDIYSLGIILFEMFHPPFDTVSHFEYLVKLFFYQFFS